MLEKYLEMRAKHPQWFCNLDICIGALSELVLSGYIFVLPRRDREGRRVIFSVARNIDHTRHTNSDAMRAHIITFEVGLRIFILDEEIFFFWHYWQMEKTKLEALPTFLTVHT